MVVLGIDPGFRYAGFGVMQKSSTSTALLDYGYLKMSSEKPIADRITIFYDFFGAKIEQWQVTDLALETPFLGKNAQNFLKLGYLRGILYLLSSQKKLALHEFSPRQVKTSVTGFGGAEKEQVARMVLKLFPTLQMPKVYDVTDAVAVTLCGFWQASSAYATLANLK